MSIQKKNLTSPTVAVSKSTIEVIPLELGNKHKLQIRTWIVDIFGATKTQRDDYAYLVFNLLDDNIPVYNYDEGFPPAVTPT